MGVAVDLACASDRIMSERYLISRPLALGCARRKPCSVYGDWMTPDQSRAARGLLDWSQAELAARSNLSESTIRDFEKAAGSLQSTIWRPSDALWRPRAFPGLGELQASFLGRTEAHLLDDAVALVSERPAAAATWGD